MGEYGELEVNFIDNWKLPNFLRKNGLRLLKNNCK